MRADLFKTVEACILAVVLVAVLTAGFYHAGMGAMLGLLVGLFILLHLFWGFTWNKGGHGAEFERQISASLQGHYYDREHAAPQRGSSSFNGITARAIAGST